MAPFRIKQTILALIILSSHSCDIEEKVKKGIDAAFIEVKGKVTHNGSNVSGALVLLIEGAEISDGLELSNGSITGQNGNYNIYEVSEGEYYIVAIEDNNGNLTFDADTDRLGFHGVDPSNLDLEPDMVTVTDEDVENINITYLVSL
jgi:uncharacterized protein (DUF2141 family)